MYSTIQIVKRLAFFCFLALAVTGSKAQDSAAIKILSIHGSVQITRLDANGTTRTTMRLGTDDSVYTNDIIRTNSGGQVVLKLTDGSQAIISENTIVEIKDTINAPRTIFNVLKGKTRIKIEKLGGKPNPYRVTTPTTVIAVRGTMFDVLVKGDKTDVYVNEGEVSVTSIELSQEVILMPGNFTQVERNHPPRTPTTFTPQQNDRFFNPRNNSGREINDPNNKTKGNPGQGDMPGNSNNPRSRKTGKPPNQPPPGNISKKP